MFENIQKKALDAISSNYTIERPSSAKPEAPVDVEKEEAAEEKGPKSFFRSVGKRIEEGVRKTPETINKFLSSPPKTIRQPRVQGPEYLGSTRANRNNNPLNIKFSPYTADYSGVIGLDEKEADDGGQFLKFRSVEDGFKAAERLIQTENYVGLTVDQAMNRWSNGGYGGEIVPNLSNKIIGDLSDKEIEKLVIRMASQEGFDFSRQGGLNPGLSTIPPVRQQQGENSKGGIKGLGAITTMPGTATRYEGKHPGVDIANKKGTPIPSFTNGIVVAIERGKKQGDKGFGNFVTVKDRDGNLHRYSHMERGYVKIGDTVTKGQPIGTMGNSGSTYSEHGGDGSHLDYRIASAYGKYMNPLTYIKNFG